MQRAPRRLSPPDSATEVAEGVFAFVQPEGGWFVNNAGFLVGRAGVTLVDTCATAARTRALLDAVARASNAPVKTLVNTHHHGDHTYGNCLVPGATIVGHQRTREALLRWGRPPAADAWTDVEWGGVELEPPFLTFETGIRLHVDHLLCEVFHVGTPAHTDNDSVVWVPDRGVLFSGDLLFNGVTPLMMHGSIAGSLRALDTLAELRPEVVVPGHGPVGGPEMITDVRRYLLLVQRLARDGRAAGLTPLDAARDADLGEFATWLDAERLVGNLHRAYAEESGAAPGERLDSAAALADMVALHGGPLPTRA